MFFACVSYFQIIYTSSKTNIINSNSAKQKMSDAESEVRGDGLRKDHGLIKISRIQGAKNNTVEFGRGHGGLDNKVETIH